MENKTKDKMLDENKIPETPKQPSRAEYGDKAFQNPYLSDKPIDQTKTTTPADTAKTPEAGLPNQKENVTKTK